MENVIVLLKAVGITMLSIVNWLFPIVAISCLIWYELDPNIETIYAKIHLAMAGLFAAAKII